MAATARSFREHFLHPSGIGRLEGAQRSAAAENRVCGDWVQFQLRCDGERILEARIQVRGCSSVIGCASLAAETLPGLDFAAARALDFAALARAAGAKPRELTHAPSVVARALESTLAGAAPGCQAAD